MPRVLRYDPDSYNSQKLQISICLDLIYSTSILGVLSIPFDHLFTAPIRNAQLQQNSLMGCEYTLYKGSKTTIFDPLDKSRLCWLVLILICFSSPVAMYGVVYYRIRFGINLHAWHWLLEMLIFRQMLVCVLLALDACSYISSPLCMRLKSVAKMV